MMRRSIKLATLLVGCVSLLAASGRVHASPNGTDESKQLSAGHEAEDYQAAVRQAVAELEAGHYPEALALFREAHELSPSARTLRGLGLAALSCATTRSASPTCAQP